MKKEIKLYLEQLLMELHGRFPTSVANHSINYSNDNLTLFIMLEDEKLWVNWVFDEEESLTPYEYVELIAKELSKHYKSVK